MEETKLNARLEVRLYPEQLKQLKDEAKQKNTSVGNLVREAIDQRYQVSKVEKMDAVNQLAKINAPVADWEQMKKEILARESKA